MLCEVLNLASQRLPIRHTASHTAPDTRYTLHSRPDRPRTLLQEKRRTNHTVHLPDRVVRSNTARTSSLHIPILHFQSADHRNRSDHTHNLKNTGRRNHCHATCSYPLYPETLFRKLSRDRTPDGTVLTPQIVPRRHGSRSEIRPSETSQNSILKTDDSVELIFCTLLRITQRLHIPGMDMRFPVHLILIQKIVFVDILVLFVPRSQNNSKILVIDITQLRVVINTVSCLAGER